ncbi:hypothetical protein ABID82_007198 [Methylobacterium sp. PvP062]|uniref:Uncharacterized protein n=1 Tax=Methylobacterium radiotolerans TaxID=31998 RepID=A0ABV2NQ35_9HYPH|nr:MULTISPECIES: hypothetical protein [unclassified Methylobacterium]MBP2494681.1 hypothetical protein [Methylobacterium sp. PvP105]MBP2505448.1 hypothetical protein [Methylobacterium sp. PvP109]MCX7336345.1 hypothetical protein [Hyphomicrobiales bacterium]
MVEIRTVAISRYAGIRLVPDPHMVDVTEDWSEVRSPSRAARRRREGHPQRIRYRELPKPEFYHLPAQNMIVAHPAVIDRLHARLVADMDRRREKQIMDAVLGRPVC